MIKFGDLALLLKAKLVSSTAIDVKKGLILLGCSMVNDVNIQRKLTFFKFLILV